MGAVIWMCMAFTCVTFMANVAWLSWYNTRAMRGILHFRDSEKASA